MDRAKAEEERLDRAIDRLLKGEPVSDEAESLPPQIEVTTHVLAVLVEHIEPRSEFVPVARARFLGRVSEQRRGPRQPLFIRFAFAARAMAAALVLMLVLGTGTVVSAAGSVPGSLLYPVKQAQETIRLQLATQPAQRAAVETDLTNQRLKELDTIIARGETSRFVEQANRIRSQVMQLRQTVERLQAMRAAGQSIPDKQILVLLQRLQSVKEAPQALERLIERAPPEARPRLLRIAQETQREFELLAAALHSSTD